MYIEYTKNPECLYIDHTKRHDTRPDPDADIIIDFKIPAGTYAARKAAARGLAITWQHLEAPVTWEDLPGLYNWFETVGRRYGLLREFRENGII